LYHSTLGLRVIKKKRSTVTKGRGEQREPLPVVEAVERAGQTRDHGHLQREFFIDNLLIRIHFIIEMILVDRPCAMGVWIHFSR